MECYTYLRNATDLLSDGKTPYERRFGQPFKGPIIPFGSLVEYHPITAKDQYRIHQFGKKVLPGLFLGYALYAGEIWKGDVLVADLEELETMDASEIYSERLNAKEVIFPKLGEFIVPIADGRIRTLGDQDLLSWRPRGHREVRRRWWRPTARSAKTTRDRELSDSWTGFTRFIVLNEKPPDGYTWSGDKKTNDLQARHFVAWDLETYVRCVETQRSGLSRNHA